MKISITHKLATRVTKIACGQNFKINLRVFFARTLFSAWRFLFIFLGGILYQWRNNLESLYLDTPLVPYVWFHILDSFVNPKVQDLAHVIGTEKYATLSQQLDAETIPIPLQLLSTLQQKQCNNFKTKHWTIVLIERWHVFCTPRHEETLAILVFPRMKVKCGTL